MGHLLLWVGFLGASFVSVSRLEQPDDKWSTIPWEWYGLWMCVGTVGIVLLRQTNLQLDADQTVTDSEYSVIQESLRSVSKTVSRLCEQSDQIPSHVLRCIDQECAEPLANFAESRQAMAKRFGMEVYADVMTEFASAERYVNRSWSAAADGYVDEVSASLKRAKSHLLAAQQLLSEAETNARD